jgi:4-nitrophenyl phosphatase
MGYKAIVIDLDGTVYHGDIIIDDAAKVIAHLAKSYKILFLTNNSTRSRADYVHKLERFGISCSKYQVITSGYASAKYIKQKCGDSRVYVIGENGLKKELVEQDIQLCEEDCNIVLVGLDKEFSYSKITKALTFILAGAAFIATNSDPFLITPEQVKPGAGALVASIERASGTKAIVTGKPSTFISELLVNELKVAPDEILMVGDRLDTDIQIGINGGMRTALVLTGATKMHELEQSSISPDYIVKSISEIPTILDKNHRA